MERAGVVTQNGLAQRHVLNRTLYTSDLHHVTDIVDILKNYEEAIDYVVNKSLSSKTDSQAGNSSTCEKWPNVHIELLKNLQQRKKVDHENADAVDYRGYRSQLLRSNSAGKLLAGAE